MNGWNALIVGLKEIASHKFRSILTMLGIILGVSSLIAMSAMVQGMENGLRESLVALGGLQKVRVEPQSLPPEQRHLQDLARGVTLHDVRALQAGVPEVDQVSPEMRLDRSPIISLGSRRTRNWMTAGVWPVQLSMMEHVVQHGRMFNEIDDEEARNVCVIGTGIRDSLFGDPARTGQEIIPLGESILINGQPFTVIGMFQHYESEQERKERLLREEALARGETPQRSGGRNRGNFAFWIKNNTVYMPLNTMWFKMITGLTNAPSEPLLNNLEVRIKDPEKMDLALTQIRNTLMITHRGVEDFSFRTQEDWAENIQTAVREARLSGGLIAGISLFVGGIGIMNIMLASISERIREIGIRKAVGASGGDVFIQILVESSVLAIIGGLLGLICSRGVVWLITMATPTDNDPVITFKAMALAFGFSAVVGLFAGFFPALKAARLSVIQSLRFD